MVNWTDKSRLKYQNSMVDKYGSLEAWKAHLSEIGKKGGKKSSGGGFAANPKLASRVGRIGGKISRRPKKSV